MLCTSRQEHCSHAGGGGGGGLVDPPPPPPVFLVYPSVPLRGGTVVVRGGGAGGGYYLDPPPPFPFSDLLLLDARHGSLSTGTGIGTGRPYGSARPWATHSAPFCGCASVARRRSNGAARAASAGDSPVGVQGHSKASMDKPRPVVQARGLSSICLKAQWLPGIPPGHSAGLVTPTSQARLPQHTNAMGCTIDWKQMGSGVY